MNFLSLIQNKIKQRDAASKAAFLHAKAYRGIDYTSAHQSPTRLTGNSRTYRGVRYHESNKVAG